MISLRQLAVKGFKGLQNRCLEVASRGIDDEIARRDAERGHGALRWFTPEEAPLVEALARIIVPSDEDTPGMDEVGVLDPMAIDTLDRLVAASPDRQDLFSRGLLSFDIWALDHYGRKFVELPQEKQVELFRAAQRVYEGLNENVSSMGKAWRRLKIIREVRTGAFYAAQLYPRIRYDCFQVFYTSRVSWTWLGYDGPPMDKGYASLSAPREN